MKHRVETIVKQIGLKAYRHYGKLRVLTFRKDMKTATEKRTFYLLIDGELIPSMREQKFDALNPSNGEAFAQLSNAQTQDVERAVKAARRAFDNGPWAAMNASERGRFLIRLAQLIRENAKELCELECCDIGKTSKQATFIDIPTAADCFEYFANVNGPWGEHKNPVNQPVKSITYHQPFGVVGLLIPWNYPLITAAWKLAPALITGNTVVFKPSPLGCVSIMRLAELVQEAGFPPGVVNILSSDSTETAQALVRHPQVDMISFTGGTGTGRAVMELAAQTPKKVLLELGGKSPTIVFSDCDFKTAIGGAMSAIFMNQGQMCTAGSRLLLQDSIYEEFLQKLIEKTKALKIGPATRYDTDFGPLISQRHRSQMLQCIIQAMDEGAVCACGGKVPSSEALANGFYFEPAILTNVTPEMTIAREETFGPILAVMKFSTVEEAVTLANATAYGLAASVWTKDLKKADEVAHQLQCGTVWINTYGAFLNEAPFGGSKQSGFGRELGPEGLMEYLQCKHICTDQTPGGKPLVASWF